MEREAAVLLNFLNLKKELFIKMGGLSLLKKKIILKNDIDELNKIVIKEKELIEKIAEINTEIQGISEIISMHMNIKEEHLTIQKIIENIDSADIKHKLSKVANDFSRILYKQRKLNIINQDMLTKKINHIKSMLDSIMLENEDLTYVCEGNDKMVKRQKVNIFDARV